MDDFKLKERYDLNDYRALMHFLRSPAGCPWDRVQTHESIRRNLLEEAYETAHAIDTGDLDNLREELGDLLMQVLFHTEIEAERGGFDLDDVADTACKKLVFRHPHVFGTASAESPEAVLETWDERKKAEKGQESVYDTLVAVAENLPALWRADKLLKKAEVSAQSTPEAQTPLDLIRRSVERLEAAQDDPETALGELLFAAVGAARQRGIDPETALHRACERYIARFAATDAILTGADT